MKRLKDFGLSETILCEGWVQRVYNPQTQTLKVNVNLKVDGLTEQLVAFLNHNHPLFDYLLQGEELFYARVQAITTGTFNEQYHNLKVNLLHVEPVAYIEPLTVNIEDLVKQLKAHLKRFKNKELYALCREVLVGDEAFRNRVFNAPSHEKQAYCYRGGLLQHIVRLMDLIDHLLPTLAHNHFLEYQTYEMNSDLLKTAALYHDLGVANTLYLNDKGGIERTLEGELVGSTAMSVEILTQMLMRIPLSDSYLAMNLRAIIASCKADIEEGNGNGSRVLPKTKEAVFFANLERLEFQDARFQSLERELRESEMIRRGGSLFVVPNRGVTNEVVETPTNEVASTPSPQTEEVVSSETVDTPQSNEVIEEGLSFLSPLTPMETMPSATPSNDDSTVGILTLTKDDEMVLETPTDITPVATVEPIFLEDDVINSVIETPLAPSTPSPVAPMSQYEPLPIYHQNDGVNPYEHQTGLNPYENQSATPEFNPYTQPVDPESGMPIESMYSMHYVEGEPLDIPETWPETPSTRPMIQK